MRGSIVAFLPCLMAWSSPAVAVTAGDWHFRTAAYVFMPDINGKQSFPAPQDIHVDFSDLVKKTQYSFMGIFEARHARVGAFVDVIYLDLGDKKGDSTRIGTGPGGGVPLPPGITADLKMDTKSWIVSFAGLYRVHQGDHSNLDLFAGARMNRNKVKLGYAFSAPFGPFQGPLQQGTLGNTTEDWDGIVGAKGRINFGARKDWFAFGYADVGTGDSKRTWQVFLGGGRRFSRLDALIGWRKLGYRYDSDNPIERLSYEGPLIGASVSF